MTVGGHLDVAFLQTREVAGRIPQPIGVIDAQAADLAFGQELGLVLVRAEDVRRRAGVADRGRGAKERRGTPG